MLPVEMRSRSEGKEELRGVGVGTRVGHRERSAVLVLVCARKRQQETTNAAEEDARALRRWNSSSKG